MSRIKKLLQLYGKFINTPWREDAAAAQRVIFCVYNENDELQLRNRIDEFEIVTRQAGHEWAVFDLSDTFADWLCKQRYANKYFEQPHLLPTLLEKYLRFITDEFKLFLSERAVTDQHVIALSGVSSLFGFLKVKDLVDQLAPLVSGRLLVFFPGTYDQNNYRLLDGYDGWNYLAVLITADKQF